MAIDLDDDLPLFTTPSGESLDELLLSMLDSAAGSIDSSGVVAISIVMIDIELNTTASRLMCHPLVGAHLAQRLKQVADVLEKDAGDHKTPQNNQSQRVH
jgi:hypothetical protein